MQFISIPPKSNIFVFRIDMHIQFHAVHSGTRKGGEASLRA